MSKRRLDDLRFLAEKLVDELYVAVGPRIFGGASAPTMAERRILGGRICAAHAAVHGEVGETVVLKYRVDDSRSIYKGSPH